MHTALAAVHVVLAVFLIGPMAVLPMVAMRELRTGNAGNAAGLARSTQVFSIASVLVLVFGFGVLGTTSAKYDLSVTTPWVLASLIAYVVALALSLGLVVPAMRHAAAGRGDYAKVAVPSGIVSLLLLLVVVLMVAKP